MFILLELIVWFTFVSISDIFEFDNNLVSKYLNILSNAFPSLALAKLELKNAPIINIDSIAIILQTFK